jgi:phosphoglycolate phosphatase-like HAD superfamily hydrolase
VDGTLVDSNDAHTRAWVDALAEAGRDVPFGRVRPLIGMGADKLVPNLLGIPGERGEGKRLSDRRTAIFRERYLPSLRPFPQARALLERMKRAGLVLVVATSAKDEELEGLLAVAGVTDLLDGATSGSGEAESKPDPDVVEAAVRRSGCAAAEAVMLGDTPYDVEAALKAGVTPVALRCGGWGGDDLRGAAAVYDDPADLLARFDESPFARAGTRDRQAPGGSGGR